MNNATLPPIPAWTPTPGYTDIRYEKAEEGIAKITINRPEVRNAFRPETVREMQAAFADARDDAEHRRDHPHRRGRGRRSARAATSACAARAATSAATACRG